MTSALHWTEEEAATQPRGRPIVIEAPAVAVALPLPSPPPKRRRSSLPPPSAPPKRRSHAAAPPTRMPAMTWSNEPSYHPVTPLPAPPPAPVPIVTPMRVRQPDRTDEPRSDDGYEPITVPAPPPVPQLARERDVPSEDDGLWKGDELIAGRDPAELAAPSAFGDHHRAVAPSWPPGPTRESLVPTALPSRAPAATGWLEGGRWLAAALLAAVAALVTWQLLAPGSGSLEIRLADAAAHPEVDVQVDGVSRCGTTPCRLTDMTAGPHVVEIGSGDGRWLRRRVDIRPDEHSLISLAFTTRSATGRASADLGQGVSLRSDLSPVAVGVDGESRGTLPILIDDLSTGEHLLRFESPGRRPLERKITVTEGEVVRLHDIALAPGDGKLQIVLSSPGARVLVGRAGQQSGRRPVYGPWPSTLELDTAHDWEVVAGGPGYRSEVFPVTFDDEGKARIEVKLAVAAWMRDGY